MGGEYSFFGGEVIIIVQNHEPFWFNGDGEDLAVCNVEQYLEYIHDLDKIEKQLIEAEQMKMGFAAVFTAGL